MQAVGNGKEEVERRCTGKGHTDASACALRVYVQTLGIRLTVTDDANGDKWSQENHHIRVSDSFYSFVQVVMTVVKMKVVYVSDVF